MSKSRTASKLYTAEQVRQLDQTLAQARGVPTWQLMQDAGKAAFQVLRANWPEAKRIIIMAGSGNNAGDGWVLAALLKQAGLDAQVFALKPPDELQGDAAEAVTEAQQNGCKWQLWADDAGMCDQLGDADVIVDALLGTGISGGLRGAYPGAIAAINAQQRPVLAVDVPSGLHADTGATAEVCVLADITVTFVAFKRGLMTLNGPDYCGRLVLADLDLDEYPAVEQALSDQVVEYCRSVALPQRRQNSHKKTYGHVVVVAGNAGMAGAGLLAGRAALRSGAGLVTLITHHAHAAHLYTACPELMISGTGQSGDWPADTLQSADAVVIGPGLGQDDWASRCWQGLAEMLEQRPVDKSLPVVVDADGLHWFKSHPLDGAEWVITPHPGEAGALLEQSSQQVQQDRFASAAELAKRYKAVAVLKGNGSIIAGADGQMALSAHGNPGMATAGMGDVLAGICGGLLAQPHESVFRQTCTAVTSHSLAGDAAAQRSRYVLTAGDVINALAVVLP